MIVVSVINQKGGVGKTTTTVNLGAGLARQGFKVLLVDLDPQANMGTHLGIDAGDEQATVYDVLVNETPLEDAMVHVEEEKVWVVPSTLDLSAAELELVSMMGRETLLRDAVDRLRQSPEPFDWVLFDCPPSLGLLTVNALTASNDVLIPLQTEFFALQGMAKLTEVIDLVQRRLNPELRLRGIVACKVDRRPRLTEEVLGEVRRFFGDRLLETMIRPNVKLAEAPSFGQSVFSYAPESNGALDYDKLVRELLGLPIEEEPEEEEWEDEAEGEWEEETDEVEEDALEEDDSDGVESPRAETPGELVSEPATELLAEAPDEQADRIDETPSAASPGGSIEAQAFTQPLPAEDPVPSLSAGSAIEETSPERRLDVEAHAPDSHFVRPAAGDGDSPAGAIPAVDPAWAIARAMESVGAGHQGSVPVSESSADPEAEARESEDATPSSLSAPAPVERSEELSGADAAPETQISEAEEPRATSSRWGWPQPEERADEQGG